VTEPDETIGLLVMAYGTPTGPDDVERYYTDVRGGRAPSPEHLEDLRRRYAAIGNRFPLLDVTRRQAEGLASRLQASLGIGVRPYVGMKPAPPFIADAVAEMAADGIERAVGVVMAPHWSGMSVETYVERVERVVAERSGPAFTFVRQWYDHPAIVDLLAGRVREALDRVPEHLRDDAIVLFTAHSLPTRTVEDGTRRCLRCDRCPDGCRYVSQLHDTAQLVSGVVRPPASSVAWQSAGRTDDPWWGPAVEDVIPELSPSWDAVVVCACGFAADHLETLYDLDLEARAAAERAGMAFVRTEMPNADPAFLDAMAQVVTDHLRVGEPA